MNDVSAQLLPVEHRDPIGPSGPRELLLESPWG